MLSYAFPVLAFRYHDPERKPVNTPVTVPTFLPLSNKTAVLSGLLGSSLEE